MLIFASRGLLLLIGALILGRQVVVVTLWLRQIRRLGGVAACV